MSKYDIGWRDSMRLKYGMQWEGNKPTPSDYPQIKTYAICLIAIACIWAWAMDRDYADQMLAEAEAQAVRLEQTQKQLADCMNGRATWSHPNATGNGYSKTVIVCKGVEEFNI